MTEEKKEKAHTYTISKLKKLSSVSQEELIKEPIRGFDTWPVLPRGILEKPSITHLDTGKITRESKESFERFTRYFNMFIQTKSIIMLFFFSAVIGIIGSFLATITYSPELIMYRFRLSFVLLIFIIILFRVAVMYTPSSYMPYQIQGEYEEFPNDIELHIDLDKINNLIMKMRIEHGDFRNLLTQYSIFIRSCLLKDSLVKALKKTKFVEINQINQLSEFYPSFSISFTTNIYGVLYPRNRDKVFSEFMSLNGAVTTGLISSGVMAFELDEDEWRKRGAQFVNEISHIDFDKAIIQLVDEIKSACKSPIKEDKNARA